MNVCIGTLMNFAQALSYLLSLGHETLTIKLGLENTETLLEALGNPQRQYPAVQLAGTNGKGSTAAFLDSICRAAKIRTGLFTSPHLISITERIRIAGESITEEDFARLTSIVRRTAETLVSAGKLETLPTFFEHVTAIALLAFREAQVELAILETGLGGRLDSTTAARAEVVAITPVAMDHEEYLGHTIEEIAAEKAAIIRPGVTAIVGPQYERAFHVILARCEALGLKPKFIRVEAVEIIDRSPHGRLTIDFLTGDDHYENVRLGLRGQHQVTNALVAVALAEALRERGWEISREAIVQGLEDAKHPGRLELWAGRPLILFDGAHNPDSARALREYLDRFVQERITMIFGAMRDKRLDEMARLLFPKAHELILTEIDNPRAASIEELRTQLPAERDKSSVHESRAVRNALRIARELASTAGLIVITGSLHLVGEAQQILQTESSRLPEHKVQH